MVYSIKIKESVYSKLFIHEEYFDSLRDYCDSELNNFQSKKSRGLFWALLVPVRTHQLKDFCQDLFFPTLFNHALKTHRLAEKIFVSIIAICIDIYTLAFRLITVLPRCYQNRAQTRENHPLHRYLIDQGVDPLLLKKDYIYLERACTNTDGSTFIHYPTVNFIELPEPASPINCNIKLFAKPSAKQLEMLRLRDSAPTMTIEVID